jgi:hypothetical protein
MERVKHQHDHEAAKGGYWIRPDGSSVPVKDPCHHTATLGAALHGPECSYADYKDGYRRGWVRITFCRSKNFGVSFWRHTTTVEAIRSMIDLMRHHKERHEVYVEAERPVEEYRDPVTMRCDWERLERECPALHWSECGEGANAKVAGQVFAWLMQRESDRRAAHAQGNLDLRAA